MPDHAPRAARASPADTAPNLPPPSPASQGQDGLGHLAVLWPYTWALSVVGVLLVGKAKLERAAAAEAAERAAGAAVSDKAAGLKAQ